ncbi:MAG: PEP-utilizing enzyme [Candidatus Woesearchaeota archaeon]
MRLVDKLKGKTAVPGNVIGELCFDYKQTDENKILCILQATPFHIEAIMKSKGLIVKRMNFVQHATIIAREFNIPCVVGVEDIFKFNDNKKRIALIKNIDDLNSEIEIYEED